MSIVQVDKNNNKRLMMLIGQRGQENEREKKNRKTKIYREMLDQQILMNQQYRKDHSQKSRDKDRVSLLESVIIPSIIPKKNEQLEQSIVNEVDSKESRSKSRFLPLLKDKNTFYRGSSRFIKLEPDPGNKTIKEARQYTQTEQIDEQQQQLDYEYDTTCERIIKQLQSLKSKPIQIKARRRLYDLSQIQVPRKAHQKHLSNEQKYRNQVHQQTSIPYVNSIKSKALANPESRYYQYLSTDLSNSQKTFNQFQQLEIDTKANRKFNKITIPGTDFKNYKRIEQPSQDTTPYPSNESHKAKNDQESISKQDYLENPTKIANISSLKNHPKQDSQQSPTLNKKKIQFRGNNLPLNENLKESSRLNSLEGQRSTFIELLRRVKNRGESLYLKFAKCSGEKQLHKI